MAENDSTQRAEPLDDFDTSERIYRKLCQAKSNCALASLLEDRWDEVPGDTLSMAMWAVRELIGDAHNDVSHLDTKRRHALRTKARTAHATNEEPANV